MTIKVCVVGLGYIGLPTATFIASKGFDVIGVDTNNEIIDKVNQGLSHFYEPDLDKLLQNVVNKGKLKASNEPQTSDVFIICVPTPLKSSLTVSVVPTGEVDSKMIKSPDLSTVEIFSVALTMNEISGSGLSAVIKKILNYNEASLRERTRAGRLHIITQFSRNNRLKQIKEVISSLT